MNHKIIIAIIAPFLFSIASASESIQITPGPYGGSKISTPWGDYVAIQDGATLWVGTTEQWNNAKAEGVMNKEGAKRFRIDGEKPNVRTYVDREARSTSLENTNLGAITTSILFGVKPSKREKRPIKPEESEYVSFLWVPSSNLKINVVVSIVDQTIRPSNCGASDVFAYCEFVIDKNLLSKPAQVIFYSKQKTPAAIQLDSIAKQSYSDIALKYKRFRGESLSKDDAEDLKQLHEIDPTIPGNI